MIVSDSHEFVFVHNPKAAGTSVRQALQPWNTRNNAFWGIELDKSANWNVDKAHSPLHVLRRLHPDAYRHVREYFSFGFTRHPIPRFVSAFNERFPGVYRAMRDETLSKDEYAGKVNAWAEAMVSGGIWNPNFTHATPQFPLFYSDVHCFVDLIIPIEAPHPKLNLLARLLAEPGIAVRSCFSGEAEKKNARKMNVAPGELLSPKNISALEEFYTTDFEAFGYRSGEY